MKGQHMPRRERGPRLLQEYERHVRWQKQKGDIAESTRKTRLTDAETILGCLVAELSIEEMKNMVLRQHYKGDYENIIKDLKAAQ